MPEKRKVLPLILLYTIYTSFLLHAQNLEDIKLNGFYCCKQSNILSEISEKFNVRFSFDTSLFSTVNANERFSDKPLSEYLDDICKKNKWKYYSDENNIIHIVDRWKEINQKTVEETKTYYGKAKKHNITVSGKVVDKENRETLPYVSVYVKGTTHGTSTNTDGYFTLLNVASDIETIEFSYMGYKHKTVKLNPDINLNEILIELEQATVDLDEIVITAENQEILQANTKQVSMIKISPVKLNVLPNLGEKDILRSFQLMPGVSAANENSSGLYVRGSTPDQTLVLYDGFTVYNVEHLFGFFSAFNSNAIKDVQLYKGGFDAEFGGRLASVVEITGKEGDRTKFNACGDISLMSTNAFIEFPIGSKASFITAARRSWKTSLYEKILNQFIDDGNNNTPSMGPRDVEQNQETNSYFYDVNSKFTYRPTEKDIISFSFYNGEDNFDNSMSPQSDGKFRGGPSFSMKTNDLTNWGNTGASLKWSRNKSNIIRLNSLISYSNYYSNRNRSSSGGFISRDDSPGSISRGINEKNNLKDFTGKTEIEYKLTDNYSFKIGSQFTYNDITYTYNQNDTVTFIDRSTSGSIFAIYLQNKIDLFNNKLSLKPGLRYNFFSGTNSGYYEPRFNGFYKITEKFNLKGSVGLYYQFAKRVIREDISQGSRDFWVLSDNNRLPVSSSLQYIFGFGYETDNYVLDVEAYYKDLANVTEYSLRIEPSREEGIAYSEKFYTGSGIAKGIDVLLQKKYGNLIGWIGYTLGQVTNNIPAYGIYDFYASNDVTHEFKIVTMYKWRKWDIGANWIFTTGRPYTVPEGIYQLTLLDGTTQDYTSYSAKNSNRLPDYHRLDLSIKYNFKFGGSAPASVGFSLFNVYNRANIWYMEYETIDNELIELPVTYLGITPNLNFTVKFF